MKPVKPLHAYKAYLFDGDGTLLETAELIYQTFLQTMRKHGGREVPRKNIIAEIGRPLEQTLAMFCGALPGGSMDKIRRDYVTCQQELAPRYLRLFPGVRETLAALKQTGKQVALVTSRKMISVAPFFRELEIYDFFDELITPEATTRHKPDPDPALLALERLGVQAEDSLFIGDARFDMECAAAAEIPTCFVSWSENDPAELPFPPDYMISAMDELLPPNPPAHGGA